MVQLVHDDNSSLLPLLPLLPSLRKYAKAPLLRGSLVQTATATWYAPPAKEVQQRFRRESLVLAEWENTLGLSCCPRIVPTGVVSLDWLDVEREAAPVCLLVPGLSGSSESAYIQRFARSLHQAGVRVACYNPRGQGGNELITPFLYSAGFTADLRRVLEHVHSTFPDAPIVSAGFSLGASYLAKYVGEEGDRCFLKGAAVFACPVDCSAMSANLSHGSCFSKLLDRYILIPSVKKALQTHSDALSAASHLDLKGAARARTMEEFDSCITAPMMDKASAASYYADASAITTLPSVRVPLLLVSAKNDMIAPAGLIDRSVFHSSGKAPLLLAITSEGSHSMAWPQGWRGKGAWAIKVLLEWVQAVIKPP